jgi:hypothetical protein
LLRRVELHGGLNPSTPYGTMGRIPVPTDSRQGHSSESRTDGYADKHGISLELDVFVPNVLAKLAKRRL